MEKKLILHKRLTKEEINQIFVDNNVEFNNDYSLDALIYFFRENNIALKYFNGLFPILKGNKKEIGIEEYKGDEKYVALINMSVFGIKSIESSIDLIWFVIGDNTYKMELKGYSVDFIPITNS